MKNWRQYLLSILCSAATAGIVIGTGVHFGASAPAKKFGVTYYPEADPNAGVTANKQTYALAVPTAQQFYNANPPPSGGGGATDAGALTGTLNDAQLSANVALLNASSNTFLGDVFVQGNLIFAGGEYGVDTQGDVYANLLYTQGDAYITGTIENQSVFLYSDGSALIGNFAIDTGGNATAPSFTSDFASIGVLYGYNGQTILDGYSNINTTGYLSVGDGIYGDVSQASGVSSDVLNAIANAGTTAPSFLIDPSFGSTFAYSGGAWSTTDAIEASYFYGQFQGDISGSGGVESDTYAAAVSSANAYTDGVISLLGIPTDISSLSGHGLPASMPVGQPTGTLWNNSGVVHVTP